MGVFGCFSIRGVCNADIGCGAKTLRCASVRHCTASYNPTWTVGKLLSYSKARLTAGLRCPGPRAPESNRHLSNGQLAALPIELPRDRVVRVAIRGRRRKMPEPAVASFD